LINNNQNTFCFIIELEPKTPVIVKMNLQKAILNKTTTYCSLFVCSVVLLTASLILYKNGVGLTNDSGYYFLAAKTFAQAGNLKEINGSPLNIFPPLYSVWLSLYSFLKIDLLHFAAVSNLFFFLISFLSSIYICLQVIHNQVLRNITIVTIALSTPLLMNTLFAWSESLFLVFQNLTLISLIAFLDSGKIKALGLLIIFSILAFFTRYIGFMLIGCVALAIILMYKGSFRQKITYSLSYFLPNLMIMVIWFTRNYFIIQKPVIYDSGLKSIWENFTNMSEIVSSYFIFNTQYAIFHILVAFTIFLFIGFASYLSYKKNHDAFNCLTLYSILYLTTFIIINSLKDITTLDDRLLSPIFTPLFIVLIASVEKTFQSSKNAKIIYLSLTLWLVYPGVRFIKNAIFWYNNGGGYNTYYWNHNTVIQRVKEYSPNQLVSNNPIPIILLTPNEAYSTDLIHTLLAPNEFTLVLWENHGLEYLLPVPEKLFKDYKVSLLEEFTEAKIYKVERNEVYHKDE
jgi:hypothetical protein